MAHSSLLKHLSILIFIWWFLIVPWKWPLGANFNTDWVLPQRKGSDYNSLQRCSDPGKHCIGVELDWRTGCVSTIKPLLLTLLLLIQVHPFSCHGFTFALEVVRKKGGVWISFTHWRNGSWVPPLCDKCQACVSPRNVESTETSHHCASVEKSE